MKKNRTAGFTLLEIMVVVAIVGMLAAIAFPSFRRVIAVSRQDSCLNSLRQIDGAKDLYALEQKIGDGAPCDMALIAGFLKKVPRCPSGDAAYQVNAIGTPPTCTGLEAVAHNAAYLNP